MGVVAAWDARDLHLIYGGMLHSCGGIKTISMAFPPA